MSASGRGRGYTGRHHLRSPRPGDAAEPERDARPRDTEKPEPVKVEPKPAEDAEPAAADKPRDKDATTELDSSLQELLRIDEQYTPLVALLEQFSPGEDGIQFNRKLRHFETTVTSMCPDEARLQQGFATFRACALLNSLTARKLAAVGASFTRQQRQQLLRATLLNVVMQGTFAKLDVLERSNPQFLINAANLVGDYFAEARLCNGNKVHILASPLLQYMKALLASHDVRAHRSLATQLMQNGRELLSVLPQELDELSISIRLRLLTPPTSSIIWLLLSADLCLNKFLPLPNTLQQFYAAHLDLISEDNYSEVSYGSWKKEKEEYRTETDPEKISANVSQISLNHEESDTVKPKLRPILGAGAGLLRQEQALSVNQDNFDTWTVKNSLSKRYDLNSWRQDENKKEDSETVYNPTVLPPNLPQNFPVTVPDYPPPNVNRFNSFPQENYQNYLQQGDGVYIQSQFPSNSNFNQQQGDGFAYAQERPAQTLPERVNSEVQKAANNRRPVENWRREKSETKEDTNRNKRWPTQRSKDSLTEDEDNKGKEEKRSTSRSSRDGSRPANRANSRSSTENNSESGKTPPRRHVTEVPRSQRYWDHDDRCDKDYNS